MDKTVQIVRVALLHIDTAEGLTTRTLDNSILWKIMYNCKIKCPKLNFNYPVIFDLLAIQLEFEKGTIASHSKLPVQLTVKPHRQARYLWTISYQILSTTGK